MFNPAQTAYLFPGQGSQFVGMGFELAQTYPHAREIFEQADEILGFSLSRLAWEGPEEELNDTINTQPALFVHSAAVLRLLDEHYPGYKPSYLAGHSMGELSALFASGAIPFAEALQLVRKRGELMKLAGNQTPGGMAAILGLEIPVLDQICAQASTATEPVQVANDNCPGQVVISGSKPALDRAMELARVAGARKVVPLAVSIPAHSILMSHAQSAFTRSIEETPITSPNIPLVGNVAAAPLTTLDEIRNDLRAQLTSRVRWTESIQWMASRGINTFLELGAGNVLVGLLKRIDRQLQGIAVGTPSDLDKLKQLA